MSVNAHSDAQQPTAPSAVLGSVERLAEDVLSLEDWQLPPHKRARMQKYDPRDEPVPDHPFFNVDLAAVQEIADSICEEFLTIVENAPAEDHALYAFRNMVKERQKLTFKTNVRVALTGDTGKGKSSVINCLLHQDGATPTSNKKAGTQIPIVFRGANSIHLKRSEFETNLTVLFKSEAGLNALAECMRRICTNYHSDRSDNEKEINENIDDQYAYVVEWVKRLARLASIPEAAAHDIATSLNMWMQQALDRHAGATSAERTINQPCGTVNRLQENMTKYMSGDESVLVERLDVQCNNALVLEGGCELLDIPSTNDDNLLHEHLIAEYRRTAHIQIVILEHDRYENDNRAKERVRKAILETGSENNVIIVIPKIDTIGYEDRDTFNATSTSVVMNTARAAMVLLQSYDGNAYLKDAYESYMEGVMTRQWIESNCCEMRTSLVSRFRSDGTSVCVFPVYSSKSYFAEPAKRQKLDATALSPKQSGIPELRAHLQVITATSKAAELKTFVQITIPTILTYANMIAMESTSQPFLREVKGKMWHLVRDFYRGAKKKFQGRKEDFMHRITDGLDNARVHVVPEKGKDTALLEEIRSIVNRWQDEARVPSTYKRLIRDGGWFPGKAISQRTSEKNSHWGQTLLDDVYLSAFIQWKARFVRKVDQVFQDEITAATELNLRFKAYMEHKMLTPETMQVINAAWNNMYTSLYQNISKSQARFQLTIQKFFGILSTTETASRSIPNGIITESLKERLHELTTVSNKNVPGLKGTLIAHLHSRVLEKIGDRVFIEMIGSKLDALVEKSVQEDTRKLFKKIHADILEFGDVIRGIDDEKSELSDTGRDIRNRFKTAVQKVGPRQEELQLAAFLPAMPNAGENKE